MAAPCSKLLSEAKRRCPCIFPRLLENFPGLGMISQKGDGAFVQRSHSVGSSAEDWTREADGTVAIWSLVEVQDSWIERRNSSSGRILVLWRYNFVHWNLLRAFPAVARLLRDAENCLPKLELLLDACGWYAYMPWLPDVSEHLMVCI
jgi:hypothetical protein